MLIMHSFERYVKLFLPILFNMFFIQLFSKYFLNVRIIKIILFEYDSFSEVVRIIFNLLITC